MSIIKNLDLEYISSKINDSKRIIILEEIDSTNNYIKQLYQSDYNNEMIVIAESQTSGRGRLGRNFLSNKDSGIYMSYLIKPRLTLTDAAKITVLSCVAICVAIEKLTSVIPQIKWVNDIYINNKKVCGILTEAKTVKDKQIPEYIVIGVGINCYKQNFGIDLENIATSIEDETNKVISRNDLIAEIINNIDSYIKNDIDVIDEYIKHSFIIGKMVEIKQFDKSFMAKVLGITSDAKLLVESLSGEVLELSTGEISRVVIK